MKKVNLSDLKFRDGDSGAKYLFRGPNIDWGVLRLLPGQTLGHHYHEEVEETFFFPHGAPRMNVNGEEIRIKPGDALQLSPKDTHDIINDTAEAIDIIFIKHIHKPDDKVKVE